MRDVNKAGGRLSGWVTLAFVPVLSLALAVAALSVVVGGELAGHESGPVLQMRDLSGELTTSIRQAAVDGLAKTRALAADERLAGVIAAGDRAAGERLADDLLAESLELDIVAIFDPRGSLLAVSTLGRDRVPLARERIEPLYRRDFSGTEVVQSCLRRTDDVAAIEFQTGCDFTPPYFDSSGLSVAFSATIAAADGSHGGVVSTRLNFERISGLVRETSFVRAGNKAYLVTDDGMFFDEGVNSGRVEAPLAASQVRAALATDSAGDGVLVQRDNMVLLGSRVEVPEAAAIGGISVVLNASEDWVRGETLTSRLLVGAALLGSLLAAAVWCFLVAARTQQARTRSELSSERARTALILDGAAEGIIDVDPSGTVRFANPAARAALRLGGGGGAGQSLDAVMEAGKGVTWAAAWRSDNMKLTRGDKTAFPARVSYALLPDKSGGVLTLSDRTAELDTEQRLLSATRQAGMAEVATGVLHNIGNVLNSVNVAACLMTEKLRQSEAGNLARAGEMLHERKADLGAFLTSDERGRHLPDYIAEASKALAQEQAAVLHELDAVTKGIAHVKQVVTLQQAHARQVAIEDSIMPADLFESALKLLQDSLTKHEVGIERRFDPIPAVRLDTHRVLQILVNLISNAKHAVAGVPVESRRLALSVRDGVVKGERAVRFEVSDNGVGIPAENLCKVFALGFTTRPTGHGFGLHSAANAAQQMGGSLTAASPGPGRGATFVLTLPIAEAADAGAKNGTTLRRAA